MSAPLRHAQEFDSTVRVGVDPGVNRKSRPDWQCLACRMLIDRRFVQSLSRKKEKTLFLTSLINYNIKSFTPNFNEKFKCALINIFYIHILSSRSVCHVPVVASGLSIFSRTPAEPLCPLHNIVFVFFLLESFDTFRRCRSA